MTPPTYAGKLRELASGSARVVSRVELEAIATALEFAAEVLKGGAHEGACDYPPPFGPCSLHVATYERRFVALRQALDAVDALR